MTCQKIVQKLKIEPGAISVERLVRTYYLDRYHYEKGVITDWDSTEIRIDDPENLEISY